MTEGKERAAKVIEVAFVTAASDGMAQEEALMFVDKLVAIPLMGVATLTMLKEQGFAEGEEEIGVLEFMEAATDLKMDELELIELSDSYLKEASSVIGEGIVINNLCVALCMVLCAGDGNISDIEAEAFNKVAASLPNIDSELSSAIAEQLFEMDTGDILGE